MLSALMPISSFPYVAACLLIASAAIRGSGSITRPERCRRSNSQGHRMLGSNALLPASSRGRRSGLAQDARLLLRCALSAAEARFPHRFGSPEAGSTGIVRLRAGANINTYELLNHLLLGMLCDQNVVCASLVA